MKRLLPAFLILLFASPGFAQKASSAQTLRLAQATYESGRLHEVEGFLRDFKSTVKQEQIAAYKLLCLTFIYLEEPAKADEQMLRILTTDNYFRPSDADPAEFVALWKTFRRDPIYRIGGKFGSSISKPNVISFIPSNDGKSEYKPGIGFQGGFTFELPLTRFAKGLTFSPELNFSYKSFNYVNDAKVTHYEYPSDEEPAVEEQRDFKTSGKENHMWISLPMTVQYNLFQSYFEQKKLQPFIGLGISTDFLLNARSTFLRTKENASSQDEETLDLTSERTKLNISAIASAGFKLRITGGYAIAEVRYSQGFSKISDIDNIYAIAEKTFPTGYVDGVFKLSSLSVSVGYVYNIFNPKKLVK
jgi:hypothetical protein